MFRIYTQNVNRESIRRIVSGRVDGWTEYEAIGAWRGTLENSLIVELFNVTYRQAEAIAKEIAVANNQEAVALVELPETTVLVQGKVEVSK